MAASSGASASACVMGGSESKEPAPPRDISRALQDFRGQLCIRARYPVPSEYDIGIDRTGDKMRAPDAESLNVGMKYVESHADRV